MVLPEEEHDPTKSSSCSAHALRDEFVGRAGVGVQVPGLLLIPQRVENYRPPEWPGASIVHLDLTAGEHLDEPVKRAVALGARPADPQPDPRWKVLLDPAGHPFCLTTLVPPPDFLAT